jgi:putative membrane protein
MRMINPSRRQRVINGTLAGLVAGIVGSWAANQFHSLWSALRGEEQYPEIKELSARGGRPDSAAAKEQASATGKASDDATVKVASKLSESVLGRTLHESHKHPAGVAVHYGFGAAFGALYGAAAEVLPSTTVVYGVGFGIAIWAIAVELALPMLDLAEPPWRYPIRMHAYSSISHCVYGVVTDSVRRGLKLMF